ncbi:MAG: KH domain-containing protein [Peptoniphilus sp.]|uniref:KH domain-containing protein n=1 Tax=Peptoniphilus sp. TaxID=1971214 RepID=UPI002A757486|nr:KH domain-containing protein [Peptoniphilus sp.]MDY2986146.1 KH domain-containing protein [Peptoniphilus sp.]
MVELVEYIAKSLVDNPDSIKLESKETDEQIDISLYVLQSDMGKVIGRQGKIAKAIRGVLKAVSLKENKRVNLEIEELE